jgi:hypothetical protein
MNPALKTFYTCVICSFSVCAYSQDTLEARSIDSLVKIIDNADFPFKRDTIKYNRRGYSGLTYVTIVTSGSGLKKYVSDNTITRKRNRQINKTVTNSTFYFNQNKLVKVEEFIISYGKKVQNSYYYKNEKPIFSSSKANSYVKRDAFMLQTAKGILNQHGFK